MTDNLQLISDYFDTRLGIKPFAGKQTLKRRLNGKITINVGFPGQQEEPRWREELAQTGVQIDRLHFHYQISAHNVQSGLKPHPEVKNIIAVASGKGGVGKSTVSVNLALALKQLGANVGILDADIYGPSQAKMLGGAQKPTTPDGKTITPVIRHGLQSISIGDLVEEDTAMIWRGPMVTQTLIQLMNETQWQALDYLIVDLPPGTGDTQLTLAQQIPVSGAVIVTTPQDIALLDAKKAKTMFDKVHIAVLGLVENMSVYRCPQCGHEAHIFGADGGKQLADKYGIALLGQLPLSLSIREQTDSGNPSVIAAPDSEIAATYRLLALKLTATLALTQKNFSRAFPKIVVEK